MKESLYSCEKAKRTDPWHTVLTSSQGNTRPAAHMSVAQKEVSIQMEWPFCTLQFCGWDPTLGDALISIHSTFRFQTFPKPRNRPNPYFTMLNVILYYTFYYTYTSAATVQLRHPGLFTKRALSKFGERKKQETACVLTHTVTCSAFFTIYFSPIISQLVPIFYCMFSPVMCGTESDLMRACLSEYCPLFYHLSVLYCILTLCLLHCSFVFVSLFCSRRAEKCYSISLRCVQIVIVPFSQTNFSPAL